MSGVLNLSSRPLSADEITVLSRGLKFCPTPPCPDPGQGREDMEALHKRLWLMSHFKDEEGVDNTQETVNSNTQDNDNLLSLTSFKHTKFNTRSIWEGSVRQTNLEAFIASNERD